MFEKNENKQKRGRDLAHLKMSSPLFSICHNSLTSVVSDHTFMSGTIRWSTAAGATRLQFAKLS